MLVLLGIMVSAFFVGLSGALSPGPMLALTIDHSLRKGFRAGPLIVFGHAILEFALILVIVAGVGDFLQKPAVIRILSILGGGMLVFLGQDMVRNTGTMNLSPENKKQITGSSVLGGILTSLSNPYWTLWWVVIGFVYLGVASQYGFIGIICFFIGHISSDLVWYSIVSFSLSRGKTIMSPVVYRVLVCCCGVFLILFGVLFFVCVGCFNKLPEFQLPVLPE